MPQQKGPIKQRPKVEDESTGNPPERHGKHRERDPGLAGKGSRLGGLNRDAGVEHAGDQDEARGTKGTSQRSGDDARPGRR